MTKFRVPIFTEEYSINVCVGNRAELIKEIIRYGKCTKEYAEDSLKNFRGKAYDSFPDANPLIVIDGELPAFTAIATLAHESSHAMDFIKEYLGIEDKSGEFHAHGIAAVLRAFSRPSRKK